MPVVKLYASLRKLAGVKELPITGATLEAVLNGLVKQIPRLMEPSLKMDNSDSILSSRSMDITEATWKHR